MNVVATHLYRYQACEHLDRLERILLYDEIYFPTAAELNDPAECRPRFARSTARHTARFLVRAWSRSHPEASLMDVAATFSEIMEAITRSGQDWLRHKMTTSLHESTTKTRIYSMSKRWDNMSLWATYARDHSGYCLEFANTGIFTAARAVDYQNAVNLDVTSLTIAEDAFLGFFQKTSDWSNEEEVRLAMPAVAPPIQVIDPACVTRIILGKDTTAEHRRQIRHWSSVRIPELLVVEAQYDPIAGVLKCG